MTPSSGYIIIDKLVGALTDHRIHIEVLPLTEELKSTSFCRLHFKSGKLDCMVSVDDEYGDGLPESHPALLLHLLLRGCDDYMDAEDFLVWCTNNGLQPDSTLARNIYDELRQAVPFILEFLGPDVKPISGWDYELATGVTQSLRNMAKNA